MTIAADVAPMSAAPMPWTMREPISHPPFMLRAQSSEATVNTAMPSR